MSGKRALLTQENYYNVLAKNGYLTLHTNMRAVGFRTAEFLHAQKHQTSLIAEDYLINSYLHRDDIENECSIAHYLTDESLQMIALNGQQDITAYEKHKLGKSIPLNLKLDHAIKKRRSTREFTGDPLSLEEVSTILRMASGITETVEITLSTEERISLNLRSVPSGGALYPIDLYIAVLKVKGLKKAVYQYHPIDDLLTKVSDADVVDRLVQSFSDTNTLTSACPAVIVLFKAQPWRTMRKYGNRGLRFVFQEIGAMSQNIHLCITALGLGGSDYAGFYESDVNEALNIDGLYQTVLHTVIIGQTV